jgi:hypothetical protein
MKTCVMMLAVAYVMTGCGGRTDGSGGSGGAGGTAGAGGSGGAGGTGGSGGGGMVMTVHQLRTATPADGTLVTLQNVVVVARVASSKNGRLYVQDAGGGMQTTVQVFCNYGGTTPTCTNYTETTFEAFMRGQVISVTGKVSHYTPTGAPATTTLLEIDTPTMTASTQMMDPVATEVPVAMVDKTNGLANDTLKGSYVKVNGGPFTVASLMPAYMMSTCMIAGGDGGSGTQYRGWELSGGGSSLAIATTFYESFHWYTPNPCFAPPMGGTAVSNQTFHTLQGVVEGNYDRTSMTPFLQISPVIDGDLAQ